MSNAKPAISTLDRIRKHASRLVPAIIAGTMLGNLQVEAGATAEKPFLTSELIFPLEHWHNHGSCILEAPNGDLIVCWFHGSGERKSDDVLIEGARLKKGGRNWSKRFVMADTPGYPDTNCCMFIDPQGRLWLMWPTILANTWESALMKYRISSDYSREGAPRWTVNEVMHVTPGPTFGMAITNFAAHAELTIDKNAPGAEVDQGQKFGAWLDSLRAQASNKLTSRLGWFTRAHPVVIDKKRLIVPLYSDGFSISMMNISDDWGATWHTSAPLIGLGNVQPSIAQRKDGSLYTLMRDNGPVPKRLMQSESRDRGETWSPVTDTEMPNPGSGAEVATLQNGHFILISNDQESGRHTLAVQISEDEGKTWKWKRHLEKAAKDEAGFGYPSITQAKDGTLHASYTFAIEKNAELDAEGKKRSKSIKHAHFNEAWVREGDAQ